MSKRTPRWTVKSPKEGAALIAHPEIVANFNKAIKVPARHRVLVLVPCAGTKPFANAPSHKHGYQKALAGLDVDVWVVSEPLGVVPWDWQDTPPNNDYDFPPEFLVGGGRKALVERIGHFLRTRACDWKAVVLALPGHHRALVMDAAGALGAKLIDASISRCRAEACTSADFRATSHRYRNFLRREVTKVIKRTGRRPAPVKTVGPKGAKYAHVSALPQSWCKEVAQAASLACKPQGGCGHVQYNIVKRVGTKISLLDYPDFEKERHPALHRSVTVDLGTGKVTSRQYKPGRRPILHRKELFVSPDHPMASVWAKQTAEDEAAGVFDDPSRIGRQRPSRSAP